MPVAVYGSPEQGHTTGRFCFIDYYFINDRKRKEIISTLIEKLAGKDNQLFSKLFAALNDKKMGVLTFHPHIGLTQTLTEFEKYLSNKDLACAYINLNSNSNQKQQGKNAYNYLARHINGCKSVTDDWRQKLKDILIDIFKKFLKRWNDNECKYIIIDNLEKSLLQMFRDTKKSSKRNIKKIGDIKVIRSEIINTLYSICQSDKQIYITLGIFYNSNDWGRGNIFDLKKIYHDDLYEEWKILYNIELKYNIPPNIDVDEIGKHFSLCFFKEFRSATETNNTNRRSFEKNNISDCCKGSSECIWLSKIEEAEACDGWDKEVRIKWIYKCGACNPYWVVMPLSKIAILKNNQKCDVNLSFDDLIKKFFKKENKDNILYDFMDKLPFYLDNEIRYDIVNEEQNNGNNSIKNIIILWFKNAIVEIINEKTFEDFLNNSYEIWVQVNKNIDLSVRALKEALKNKYERSFPEIDYDDLVNAIFKMLNDVRAVKIEKQGEKGYIMKSLHPYIAYVYSNLKIYNKF